jgi:pimeloyl-ACP methyl ester carboxylesterase
MNQIHSIIQMVREGKIPEVRVPKQIVYVGHSYGSIIGNALNRVWPDDVDATILTGFGGYFITAFPSILAQLVLIPADIEQPERYGTLDPGYLEATNQNEINYLFYYPGGYDPDFANYDFSIRGTFALGEAATVLLSGNTATEYTNPILVATGNYDNIFCNQLSLNLLTVPSCSDVPLVDILNGYNYVESAVEWYPNADFEYYIVPDAGHCWQFHYSASEGFRVTHEWMANKGF